MALQALRRKHVVSTVVLALALVAVGVARDIPSGMPVQAGWLYVVDANNGAESASVWIVDPERQEVVGRLGTGYRPDIAVSRDGTRLYLAHGVREPGQVDFSDVVDVIDTANGTLVKRVESEDRSISTLPLYWPLMVVSDDDRWLFQMKQKTRDDGVTEYSIGTLDLTTLRFLPERAPVPMCFTGMLLPQPGNGARLAVVCSQTEDLRLLSIGSTGGLLNARHVPIAARGVRHRHHGTAFFTRSGNEVTAVVPEGEFLRINPSTGQIIQRGIVDQSARRPPAEGVGARSLAQPALHDAEDWLVGRWMRPQPPLLSADGARLVLGLGEVQEKLRGLDVYRSLAILDAFTFERVGSATLADPAWGLALSKSGRWVYTFSGLTREQGTMTTIDLATGREVDKLSVGSTPVYAIEAP